MVENIRLTNSARIVGGAGFDILTCGEAGFRIAGSAVLQLDLAVQGHARIENVGKSQSCMVSKWTSPFKMGTTPPFLLTWTTSTPPAERPRTSLKATSVQVMRA